MSPASTVNRVTLLMWPRLQLWLAAFALGTTIVSTNPADEFRCTVIDTGHTDGCWHVQEPVEEVLAAIEAEKARTLGSLARDIWALESRVASLEADRNRCDELDSAAALTFQCLRG